jgi:hypothetical protein
MVRGDGAMRTHADIAQLPKQMTATLADVQLTMLQLQLSSTATTSATMTSTDLECSTGHLPATNANLH